MFSLLNIPKRCGLLFPSMQTRKGLKNHLTSNSSKRQSQNSNPGLSDSKTFVPKIIDSFVFMIMFQVGKVAVLLMGGPISGFPSISFCEVCGRGYSDVNLIYETLFMAWKWWERAPSHSGDFYLLKTYTLNVLWSHHAHDFLCNDFTMSSRWFLSTGVLLIFLLVQQVKRHDHLLAFSFILCQPRSSFVLPFPKNGPPKSSPFLFPDT